MKRLSIILTILLSCSSAWAAEEHAVAEEHGAGEEQGRWEIGIDGGMDYGSQQSLVAISAAAPLGEGYKAILEYAAGRHGDLGSNVSSLKIGKEIFSASHFEIGIVAGVAYADALDDYGDGVVAGIEAAFPLSEQVALKIEATRFYGEGRLSYDQANVVQGGVIYKF
jgi:hypothetical protein